MLKGGGVGIPFIFPLCKGGLRGIFGGEDLVNEGDEGLIFTLYAAPDPQALPF